MSRRFYAYCPHGMQISLVRDGWVEFARDAKGVFLWRSRPWRERQ